MKWYIYILLTACLMLSSCYHDEIEYVDFYSLPTLGKTFVPTSEREYAFSLSDSIPSARHIPRKASSIDGVGLVRGLSETLTTNQIHQVSGTYLSDDGRGNEIRLSGAVYLPKGNIIKGVIVSCHYTVCADYEVPSQTCMMDAWWATKGYAVVMPDYMGYGASREHIHPYMQGELTAKHVIDMILAVRSFLASRKIQTLSSDILLTGYSQGAHAALHTLRMIENTDLYPEYADARITIRKCIAGDGLYNLSEYFLKSATNNYIAIPCAVPMLVLGMNVGRRNPFDYEYFFSERTLTNYEEWIVSKRYTLDQLSEIIGTASLNRILSKAACDLQNPASMKFYKELQKHNIPLDYVPRTPVVLFHSKNDGVIDIYQTEHLLWQFEAGGAAVTSDFGTYGVHGMAYLRFLYKVYTEEL